jgi:predicted porin
MNKNVFVLVALAASGAAHADVDVAAGFKIYGVLDQAYTQQSVSSALATPKIYSNTGFFAAAATSRVGVKGERDLSEGFKGVMQFEQELTPDEATLMPAKNRMAFVGLEHKDFGVVRFGTQETPAYVLFSTDVNGRVEYKPQLWRYMTAPQLNSTTVPSNHDRANNAIKLVSPKFGPVSVEFMRGFNEVSKGGSIANNNDFTSFGVNFQEGQLSAKAVWDALTNTALSYALPGEPNAGVLTSSTSGVSTPSKSVMIRENSSNPLQRLFTSVTYDMGIAKLNYIFGAAYTESRGQVITNTFGIRVPMDKFSFALSTGMGSYSNAADSGRAAAYEGKLSDTTFGAYYNFDKATSAYLLTSLSRNTPTVSSTNFTADTVGETKTTAVGLRYNY